MPHPKQADLEALIDALGIHLYTLRTSGDALERLWDRLPSGDRGPVDAIADAVLTASPRTALITTSRWADDGSRESTDIVLAEQEGTLYVFARDPEQPSRLVAQPLDEGETRELLRKLAKP